ncbi:MULTISPECIES: NAD(P)/FAD-dependent oxidoreductase [unclassified Gemella]|uniref:protoporphyrinogen/coproporphyrinogen oxidase n=1 Tax=unclassified Gemella TaxID=2624949 RepID=UPI001073B86C|nr:MULTISPECIES: FAD-dependent oxidoreductase [unclassified Gemella]MBF0710602.1 FAD-dependent oxidoreductase [Gemella sp. GL1.1]MBF0746419.1 FAD-dependent oxidoreductase [Gemella sp. 19428wG2_WT2a]NYS27946.1 FAD-dependent oxidoreductase [Gemella sp. GL1]TFU60202.1 FAD-dependent oxidoreductase [Gemella sp. WT2a]
MKNIAVIGGGISGVSIAYFLDRLASAKSKKMSIDIIEKQSEFARDKIGKFEYKQEIYDSGWHNSITDAGILYQVMIELGLYRYLIKSKKVYKLIYTKDGIKSLPERMLYTYPLDKFELMQSGIFSVKEKLSIFLKLHKNKNLKYINRLTVEDYFKSTLNSNVYKKIVEPVLTSHYGSDVSKQSIKLLMPELAEIQNGSDLENKIRKLYDDDLKDNIVRSNEYKLRFTLRSFLENLESYFSNRVFIRFDNKVEKLERREDKYVITIDGRDYFYDYIIVSVKHREFLPWFQDDIRLQRYYKGLKYVDNLVVIFILNKNSLQVNPEIGEIIFDKEVDTYTTKLEYVSNKWIDIKSRNIHMLRAYVNRQDKVRDLLKKTDEEIINIIHSELFTIHENLEIEKALVTRAERNYIYADIKYSRYMRELDRYFKKKYGNIYFIGHSKKAINLEETIIEAREAAKEIIEQM